MFSKDTNIKNVKGSAFIYRSFDIQFVYRPNILSFFIAIFFAKIYGLYGATGSLKKGLTKY